MRDPALQHDHDRARRLLTAALAAIVTAHAAGWGTLVWFFSRNANTDGNPADGLALGAVATLFANLAALGLAVWALVVGRGGGRSPVWGVIAIVVAMLGFTGTAFLGFLWALSEVGIK